MVPEFYTVVGKIHLGPCVQINGPGFKEKSKYDNNLSHFQSGIPVKLSSLHFVKYLMKEKYLYAKCLTLASDYFSKTILQTV